MTGILPTVLVTIWQTCVLPYAFYWRACLPGQRRAEGLLFLLVASPTVQG